MLNLNYGEKKKNSFCFSNEMRPLFKATPSRWNSLYSAIKGHAAISPGDPMKHRTVIFLPSSEQLFVYTSKSDKVQPLNWL